MTKLIPDIDWFSLEDEDKNKKIYRQHLAKRFKKEIYKINEHAIIYKFKSEFFCLDAKLEKVTYYMKYEVDVKPKIGQYVWQSLVWTDPYVHDEYLNGYANKVFFEQLLPKFHTIATDSEQSWHGKRFWQIRIANSFRKNLNVYFYDFQSREFAKLNKYEDLQKYQEKYDIWGETDRHKLKRMVISDKDLL
jgi:hypothetical protein